MVPSKRGTNVSSASVSACIFFGICNAAPQAPAGRIKLEFNAVHSHHLRVTKKDQAFVGKCKAALTLSVQKVTIDSFNPDLVRTRYTRYC